MADCKDRGNLFDCDGSCSRSIVLACDGSKHSHRALNFYYDNIMKLDDHVFIYHAFELPSMPSAPYPYSFSYYEEWSKFVKEADKNAVEVLKSAGEHLLHKVREKHPRHDKEHHAKPHIQLYKENGRAGEVICGFCKEVQPSLLIMGSRGQGTLRRTLLGSVSDYCIHHNETNVPIMVIPPSSEQSDCNQQKD
ncbi:universal stress protein PHOS34 [Exaiptasia diaphana]|uniref:UspA domain-containing protein n=1 Tax=Exaiptasia diaphana TaxID=2652724 RepID=A0A913Y2I8_EXADI|nr:universal stress protein PHOS34 [Exaiptasia diaphana]